MSTDRNFDDLAEKFQRKIYGSLKGQARIAVLRRDLERILSLKSAERRLAILDAGGGQGQLSLHYAAQGHKVVLCDISERMLELATDPQITDPDVRAAVTATPDEGIGSVEAPRGTLTHHYQTDENGLLTKVNLIVGTTNNYAPIAMSVNKAAQALIKNGTVISNGLLNRIEMAFRNYDPCMSCATHALPGQMPLEVVIRDAEGTELERLSQFV